MICKHCGQPIVGGKGDYWHGSFSGPMKCPDGQHLAEPEGLGVIEGAYDAEALAEVMDFLRNEPPPFVVAAFIEGELDSVIGPFDSYDEANRWTLHMSLQVDEFEGKPFTTKIATLDDPVNFRFGEPDG